jgi:HNH endonuclease
MLATSEGCERTIEESVITNPILECSDPASVAKRVQRKISASSTGCWNWTGAVDRWGYGRISVQTSTGRRMTGAHRAAWLALVGNIPSGLQIDHLCRNRVCANPEHLELVTPQVNTARQNHDARPYRKGRPRKPDSEKACKTHGREAGQIKRNSAGYNFWYCESCAAARRLEYRKMKQAPDSLGLAA